MQHPQPPRPGRFGDPQATLETDPRLDPRLAAALVAAGEFAPGITAPPLGADYERCLAYCNEFEAANAALHDAMRAAMPPTPSVTMSTETLRHPDGHDITLYIHTPMQRSGSLPCVVHYHGGGMVLMSATDPGFERLRNDLAATGLVVIGVEFRNGGGRLGPHPFPAGLDDCSQALEWVHAQRDQLDLSAIITSGESGGGNLAIATALRAHGEGRTAMIDGVFAMCPYISGRYASPPPSLPSLSECDGYMLDAAMMQALVTVYDPTGAHADDPLAWPLHASEGALRGLPPHVISVNELDPLRDEGLAFYRKLLAAGVPVMGRTVMGTPHAGDGTFPDVVPDVYRATVDAINAFARSVAT